MIAARDKSSRNDATDLGKSAAGRKIGREKADAPFAVKKTSCVDYNFIPIRLRFSGAAATTSTS